MHVCICKWLRVCACVRLCIAYVCLFASLFVFVLACMFERIFVIAIIAAPAAAATPALVVKYCSCCYCHSVYYCKQQICLQERQKATLSVDI